MISIAQRRLAIACIGMAMPCTALSHGEEVLLLPVGQLAAVVVLGLALWWARPTIWEAMAAVIAALAASFLIWIVPNPAYLLGSTFPHRSVGNFVSGLVPPVIAALAVLWWCRHGRRKARGA